MSDNKTSKPKGLIEEQKDNAGKIALQGALTMVEPYIDGTIKKIEDYLGDNVNMIVIMRPSLKHTISVMSIKTDGEHNISNDSGEKVFEVNHRDTDAPEAVNWRHNVKQFMQAMLSGDLDMKK